MINSIRRIKAHMVEDEITNIYLSEWELKWYIHVRFRYIAYTKKGDIKTPNIEVGKFIEYMDSNFDIFNKDYSLYDANIIEIMTDAIYANSDIGLFINPGVCKALIDSYKAKGHVLTDNMKNLIWLYRLDISVDRLTELVNIIGSMDCNISKIDQEQYMKDRDELLELTGYKEIFGKIELIDLSLSVMKMLKRE